MPDFAIIDPKFGIGEDVPTITLSEAFLAKGSQNVHHRYGRYDRLRGRLPDLVDSESVAIKTPTDVFVITSINVGLKRITIIGNHSAGATALSEGDTFRVNGGTTEANNITFTVDSLPDTDKIITVETIESAGATKGNVFVGKTPVIRYHRHVEKDTGTERFLLGTKYHLFLWANTAKTLAVKWTNLDPDAVERWEIVDHLRNVVATNNSDFVLWWNVDGSAGNDFVALDNADGIDFDGTANRLTNCKHIASYETYLMLGFTTEGGNTFPQRQRWAGRATGGSDIDFDENGDSDAGFKEFTNTPGTLMGFARHGDDFVISKEDSMHRSWLVTADTVFEWQEYTLKVGNLSADSLVNDKAGRLYWFGSDLSIREINTPRPISLKVDITIKQLNSAQAEFIQATFIDEFDQIWWAFASGASTPNDKIISFHPDSGRSVVHSIPVRAFGDFTQQESFSWDTLPYGTYAAWGADWLRWDTKRNRVGFPLDISSDYNGNTFDLHRATTDVGEVFTGVLILSTTLTAGKSLNVFKRINNGCDLIFNRKSSGSVDLYAKRDTEKSWQFLGTISLVDTDEPEHIIVHVPFDLRAKTFQFKLESPDDMEMIGLIFREFEFDGNR